MHIKSKISGTNNEKKTTKHTQILFISFNAAHSELIIIFFVLHFYFLVYLLVFYVWISLEIRYECIRKCIEFILFYLFEFHVLFECGCAAVNVHSFR